MLVLLFQQFSIAASGPNYPEAWWQEIPREDAKSWEILPQDAGPGEVILSKRTELGIFSNFGFAPFNYEGARYASVEAFWQMMKFPESVDDERTENPNLVWPHTRSEVMLMHGFAAKHAGDAANKNMKILGIRWITYKGEKIYYKASGKGRHYELIYGATLAKIQQNPKVKSLLLQTKGLRLRPDHTQHPGAPPAYEYFEILMKIRDQF